MSKFEVVRDNYRKYPDLEIIIPTRSTVNSAGYDIHTPIDFVIEPKSSIVIPTDIKVKMSKDEVMLVIPRSSVGIKRNIILMNTTGVIDSDYYSNDTNDGNIMLALYNYGETPQSFKAGERIAQGIFIKYGITEDDNVSSVRKGGIGSTNK